jgi:stage V sporulation protein SpoVS
VVTGLSVSVAGVVLAAVVDEANREVRIVQRGEAINGSLAAIAEARTFLAQRVQRFLPTMRLVE